MTNFSAGLKTFFFFCVLFHDWIEIVKLLTAYFPNPPIVFNDPPFRNLVRGFVCTKLVQRKEGEGNISGGLQVSLVLHKEISRLFPNKCDQLITKCFRELMDYK